MKQMTFKDYRNTDLFIWTVLVVLFETITTIATTKWFDQQAVALSITLALTCAVMMRWNWYAVIMAMAGGLVFCIASGATIEQYLIYCIGNIFSLAGMFIIKVFGKEEIHKSLFKIFVFTATSYVGMSVGRWIVSLLFGGDLKALVAYLTTDIISLLFAVVLSHILRKCDGMFEDQKHYLLRLERERKENEGCSEESEIIL